MPELWSRDCDGSDNSGHRMLLLSEPGGIIGKSFRRVSAPGDHSLCDRPEKSGGNLFTEYEKEEICSPWILQRKTQFYRVYREGNVEFDDMPKIALQKANRKLVEGVQPYDRKVAKQFSMGYLSGFQAERRDLEKEAFGAEIARDTEQYAKRVLENDMRGYTTVRPVHQQVGNRQERWRYALVPVWVMTYKGKNGKIYYYTINGQNGKVCGELPVDYKKLSLVSALITGVVFLLGLAGGLLL